ncbi:MAG: DUF1513 domain-containing protein [Pseudomonadota bacterium]
MIFGKPIDRRQFLKAAGAGFASILPANAYASFPYTDTVFASAVRHDDGSFGVLLFSEKGEALSRFSLPDRGHDIVFNPVGRQGVVFARRPGNFALVFDPDSRQTPDTIIAPANRHFYGHGAFSHDGKLLYAAENDFEHAQGVIGIYDATSNYARIGEFSSFGAGPHEILLHPEKNILIVANGGIETHPDFGRAKLNIATMQPSLVFIDLNSGGLVEKHTLPDNFHKLSVRHIDVAVSGEVIFGCQYEGSETDLPPLIGSVNLGDEITLWPTPVEQLVTFSNYVGSVAINGLTEKVAFTLPKGNTIAVYDLNSRKIIKTMHQPESFGIVPSGNSFLRTSVTGFVGPISKEKKTLFTGVAFDNHITRRCGS